ncbi:MAG: DUF4270 domain-containing protein [Flavobacteriaceae bacterium]|jgi:hypothetical protein|nr:DUF4270 domain-containing protein [Flavobacteriaceae bacterium]
MNLNKIKILVFLLLITSCEKDFVSFDSEVINSENAINFSTNSIEYSLKNFSEKVNPVQTNSLPSFLLGSYNHPQFGNSISSFVGQIVPNEYNHDFGDNVVLDSVVLTMPYYSRGVETSEEGDITYEIDSVYGDSPIKISVFRNNFFLRTFDPYGDFDSSQSYFSNASLSVEEAIDSYQLEGELLFEIEDFTPSAEQINLTEIDTAGNTFVSQRLAPALRFKLDNPNDSFWENNFFENQNNPVLTNESNFKDFFRGLYIKIENVGQDGTMMLLNLASSNSKLTIHYTSDNTTIGDSDTGSVDEVETNQHEYIMNFSGNLFNVFDNENLIDVSLIDQTNGNENIYLDGGEGVITKLDLFSGTAINEFGEEVGEFEHFKNYFHDEISDQPKRIINEAFIEFFVNQNYNNEDEPDRIYIYNHDQNSALIDYFLDQSVSSTTINAKINHLVPLTRDSLSDNRGVKYKVRITEHLNNLILRDSTNAKLGLAVISDIASVQNYGILDEDASDNKSLASGIILSPKGTILHGNLSVDPEKRPMIKIYYTEPED